MSGDTDLREASGGVVVIGSFNPLIFQPEWLKVNEIIGSKEAEIARQLPTGVEIIHGQLVILNLASVRLEVNPGRFMVVTREAPLVLARDFALKCFRILSHTPVSQTGLNFGTVFRPRSRQAWDAFGDALAPKEPWRALLGEVGKKRSGGLTNMRMEESARTDGYAGMRSIALSIVDRVSMDTQLDYNDHYELRGDGSPEKMKELLEILEDRWEVAEKDAKTITDSLRSLCHGN